jgi:hypothetical protein
VVSRPRAGERASLNGHREPGLPAEGSYLGFQPRGLLIAAVSLATGSQGCRRRARVFIRGRALRLAKAVALGDWLAVLPTVAFVARVELRAKLVAPSCPTGRCSGQACRSPLRGSLWRLPLNAGTLDRRE